MRDLTHLPPAVAELYERFYAYQDSLERSARTADTYIDALCRFHDYLLSAKEPFDPAKLSASTVAGYMQWLKNQKTSTATRLNYLAALNAFVQYLASEKLLSSDAGDLIDLQNAVKKFQSSLARAHRKEPGIQSRLPSDEIVVELLKAVDAPVDSNDRRSDLIRARNRAILHTLCVSGMRIAELAGLRRGQLDRTNQAALVTGKGNKQRLVPIGKSFHYIESYLSMREDGASPTPLAKSPVFARHDFRAGSQPQPLTTRSIEAIVLRYAKASGILDRFHLTPHTLRHYVATKFLRDTSDLALTQDLLGHASPVTTRIYAETNHADLLAAHRSIFS